MTSCDVVRPLVAAGTAAESLPADRLMKESICQLWLGAAAAGFLFRRLVVRFLPQCSLASSSDRVVWLTLCQLFTLNESNSLMTSDEVLSQD